MLTFTLQVVDLLAGLEVHFFALFFVYVWAVWASKALLAARYVAHEGDPDVTGAAVIPVVDEPLALFREVLQRVLRSGIEQVVVVINGPRNPAIERLCDQLDDRVEWAWTPTPGKRGAIAVGMQRAVGDVVVLVDSDTLWTDATWEELRRPFADPRVGGVTTHQKIAEPQRTRLTALADWLEDIRTESSMPAMSVIGQVGCLPGRTIAFRREIVERAVPEFLTERFLGVHLEVSDDRALTNYALRYGYRTVYQRTSVVYTDAPTDLSRFARQQYRWAKGSQYNSLKMLPWMLRHTPPLAIWYSADIVIPFLFTGVVLSAAINIATGHSSLPDVASWPVLTAGALVGCVAGFALRQRPHLRKFPHHLRLLPAFVALLTVVLTPIRLWGFLRCGFDEGWGTRQNGYRGRRRQLLGAVPAALGVLMLVGFTGLGVVIEQPALAAGALATVGGRIAAAALIVVAAAALTGLVVGRPTSQPDPSVTVERLPLAVTAEPEVVWSLRGRLAEPAPG